MGTRLSRAGENEVGKEEECLPPQLHRRQKQIGSLITISPTAITAIGQPWLFFLYQGCFARWGENQHIKASSSAECGHYW